MKTKISKKTLALLIAAVTLIGAGGFGTAWAASPAIRGEYYNAWFYLNHLQVHLLENGEDVCSGTNTLDGAAKVHGTLLSHGAYTESPAKFKGTAAAGDKDYSESLMGSVEAGRKYEERIAAQNGSDVPIFLRMTVRKFWVKDGQKVTTPLPERIQLTYGDKAYNDASWVINPVEHTEESDTYYYRTTLAAGAVTDDLFDQLMIDSDLAKVEEYKTSTQGNKQVYSYRYRYNGYAFIIEADVQAIQTHNIDQAIPSQWGVTNVKATFTSSGQDDIEKGSGTLQIAG